MLTAIVSPGVIGVAAVVVLAGAGVMVPAIRRKYGYTPGREEELERAELLFFQAQGLRRKEGYLNEESRIFNERRRLPEPERNDARGSKDAV